MEDDKKEQPETPEPEKETETPEPEKGKEPESEKDIDYEKELEAKKGEEKPQFTEKEKAEYNLKRSIERAKELGIEPSEVTGIPKEEPKGDFVTKRDLELSLAESESRKLSRSEGEHKLIMWYVENKGLSVRDAYLLANKGRIERAGKEIERSEARIQGGDIPGQKEKAQPKKPMLSQADEQELFRKGFRKNSDGSYEGVKIKIVPENGTMREYKRKVGTKDQWEPVRGIVD